MKGIAILILLVSVSAVSTPLWFDEHLRPGYHWYTWRYGSARRDQGDYDKWVKLGPLTFGWGRYSQRRFKFVDGCWARRCRNLVEHRVR